MICTQLTKLNQLHFISQFCAGLKVYKKIIFDTKRIDNRENQKCLSKQARSTNFKNN